MTKQDKSKYKNKYDSNNKSKDENEDKGRSNLPKDTEETLKSIKFKIDNTYLMHNRFSHLLKDQKGKHNVESFLKQEFDKGNWFRNDKALCLLLNKRTEELANYYGCMTKFTYIPLDKLMIGVGGASPYGNLQLMSFHPLYGMPYIPATAIKGMFRQFWMREESHGDKADFYAMFGGTDDSESVEQGMTGNLVFFDMFPCEYQLDFDAQTCHYPKYYSSEGRMYPTDDQAPIPLIFPYVKDAEFHIFIACRDEQLWERLSDRVKHNMKSALQYYGIGAKTAYGYGLAMQEDE